MKCPELEAFAKQKKKEHRMKINKIKETARQQNYDRHAKKANRDLMEKYHHDAQSTGE